MNVDMICPDCERVDALLDGDLRCYVCGGQYVWTKLTDRIIEPCTPEAIERGCVCEEGAGLDQRCAVPHPRTPRRP